VVAYLAALGCNMWSHVGAAAHQRGPRLMSQCGKQGRPFLQFFLDLLAPAASHLQDEVNYNMKGPNATS
jgi:hypothetical protein